jgi:ketosteroid isomerase-like protein
MAPTISAFRSVATAVTAALLACALGCATAPAPPSNAELARQVAATERAFAKSMADRDVAAFASFVASDAVFFTGPSPLRGKEAVVARWQRFFERPQAPFSWQPDKVEVLDSGTLALSSGPVFDPDGRTIATFTSIWRLEAPGVWRIVFDKGNDVCDCKAP